MSELAIKLIKKYEGCSLVSYLCPAGIPTIGYGHTTSKSNMGPITQERADELLKIDVLNVALKVHKLVTVPINKNEEAALISFAFNVGVGALSKSTLLRCLNAGLRLEAADQFLKWDKAGGKVLKGLTKRRTEERSIFLGGNL